MGTPLRFPSTPLEPEEDPADRAMHTLIDCCVDFAMAVADAKTADRAIQLRRRLGAVREIVSHVENAAAKKMDQLD